MIPDYDFHSDTPNTGNLRLLHWLFYAGALLLLLAAVYEFYLYSTHWAVGDERDHLWQLVLGFIYLLVGGLVAWFTYQRTAGNAESPPERFVTIRGGTMTYQLDQLNGKQQLDLKQLSGATRPSVREMILEMKDGRKVTLPVYLIDNDEKQAELENLLMNAARQR
ncbi:hypothetical protein [Neolewinella litorea]|uniref:Uncharacterized protein n=1 Tax=Neolewinella litorea TaxID=2562452 RepID=A0A4S4NKF8_9BACT|nr:hypothetical protein [Neolewinella litorea]THH39435.1 hypothetical protein E4021_11830 [Neolewinella litorea]